MEPRNLLRSFDLAARAAGIKPAKDPKAPRGTKTGVDFHGLRHDFAGLLGELGVPLHVVRSMIGHSEDAMTLYYQHAGEAAQCEAAGLVDVWLRAATAT
jgi:integrase